MSLGSLVIDLQGSCLHIYPLWKAMKGRSETWGLDLGSHQGNVDVFLQGVDSTSRPRRKHRGRHVAAHAWVTPTHST